ncbi:MAG: hypothetical protein CMJ53_05675 [Planctomycetaceae bacterium]|nr:hypothetical protein [Planctomycetaceae bacterium]
MARIRFKTGLVLATLLLAHVVGSGGCFPKRYNAAKATERYPSNLPVNSIANVQVTRSGNDMVIVNGTVIDFKDMKLWLNRRYMHQVEQNGPGETVRISMGEFWDVWGGGPNPGGLLRWYDPTPVVLLEAQIDETSPLIGFLSIPNENELIKRSN